jgi:hypothetical protein
MMKRFLVFMCCVFAFSSCDDGDLIVYTVDFSEVTASTCPKNNLIFKLKESEALILNVPTETFVNNPTPLGVPTTLPINSVNQVVYNFYDGKVATANICDLIPPANPNVEKQWKATSGVIEITTVAIKTTDDTNNSSKITGYKNSIVFRNTTFTKEDGTTQFYASFIFGDYIKPGTSPAMAFQQLLTICDNSSFVYEFNSSESLTLEIDPALIANEDTPLNQPRIGTIGLVKNKLVYQSYVGSPLDASYFCQATDPALPAVKDIWLGKVGGTIAVTTTASGPNSFKHTIVLKGVTLEKDNSNFQLGDNYLYGELQTTKP